MGRLVNYEMRSDSKGLPGLGWDCSSCGAFNGDVKEKRCCDADRPGSPNAIRALSIDALEISIRLHAFLQHNGCKTIGDAEGLLGKPVWTHAKKIMKELRQILVSIGVSSS